tara:strand:- start:961 stop:1158 length:198 start_codon:yes stop_codon:yes gene_type:complete
MILLVLSPIFIVSAIGIMGAIAIQPFLKSFAEKRCHKHENAAHNHANDNEYPKVDRKVHRFLLSN